MDLEEKSYFREKFHVTPALLFAPCEIYLFEYSHTACLFKTVG